MFNWSRLWLWAATRHRDVIDTPQGLQLPQKAQPIREPLQVERLSARCPRTARKPHGNPGLVDKSFLLRVNSPVGRRYGHLLQEGGREVGHSVLLKFVDSSSTITCEGSWTSVSHPDTRCPHVSASSHFQVITREICTLGWVKEAGVPESDVFFSQKKTSLSHDGLRRPRSFGISVSTIGRETTSSYSKEKKPTALRGAVGTSTRAVACALASKPQPLLLFHGHIHQCCCQHVQNSHVYPCCRLHNQKEQNSLLQQCHRVSLIVEVTVEKQRSARESAALELQGSRAPRAPTTFNSFGSPLQATSSFPPSSRNQIACL